MKKRIFSALALAATIFAAKGQALYLPSGSAGIGAVTNATTNIGIGTPTPTQKLHVKTGNVLIEGSTSGQIVTIGSNGTAGNGWFSGPSILSARHLGIFAKDINSKVTIGSPDQITAEFQNGDVYITRTVKPSGVAINNGPNGTFEMNKGGKFSIDGEAGAGSRVTILPSGNVGFGTADPKAKLHVNGLSIIGEMPTAEDLLKIEQAYACQTVVENVGTFPGVRLFVNGAIGTIDVRVAPKSWCDYVFANDYKLKPLSEVESFIKANKHLPEVPSEMEVKAHGVSVNEMMKTHMKKIEELTLYVIELKKITEQQSAEIASLRK